MLGRGRLVLIIKIKILKLLEKEVYGFYFYYENIFEIGIIKNK